MSIGGHQSHRAMKDEWLTPPEILSALGPFDLDPCSPVDRPWPTARSHYTVCDDGLALPWHGFVWLNPPYGRSTGKWLRKLSRHGDGGIALVFARTETAFFAEHIWPEASALLFIHGRLHFHHVDGSRSISNAGGPSVLVGYGQKALDRMARSGINGALVCGWRWRDAGAVPDQQRLIE